MDTPRSAISLASWLVSAGRQSTPGAPLNVPLVPASNFILGGVGIENVNDLWADLDSALRAAAP